MGAYWYCSECSGPLKPPSFRDIEEGSARCPSCDEINAPRDTLADAFERLESRVEELEEKLAALSKP